MDMAIDGATLLLDGDFDVRSTWSVRAALYDLLEEHPDGIVVDLSGVGFIDVTALKVLAVATRNAAREGQHLTLRGCGPAVRRLLHLSRLMRFVELDREVATA